MQREWDDVLAHVTPRESGVLGAVFLPDARVREPPSGHLQVCLWPSPWASPKLMFEEDLCAVIGHPSTVTRER
jgi:hypothetical protein